MSYQIKLHNLSIIHIRKINSKDIFKKKLNKNFEGQKTGSERDKEYQTKTKEKFQNLIKIKPDKN